jgi:hypothetical protein
VIGTCLAISKDAKRLMRMKTNTYEIVAVITFAGLSFVSPEVSAQNRDPPKAAIIAAQVASPAYCIGVAKKMKEPGGWATSESCAHLQPSQRSACISASDLRRQTLTKREEMWFGSLKQFFTKAPAQRDKIIGQGQVGANEAAAVVNDPKSGLAMAECTKQCLSPQIAESHLLRTCPSQCYSFYDDRFARVLQCLDAPMEDVTF